jgi:PTS system cellobiose-specific IIC component
MFSGIVTPLTAVWTAQNATAMSMGQAMPHTWTVALERTCMWIGPNIGICLLCLKSKLKHLRNLGKASLLPVIFGVGEPIVFGCVVLNPYMMLPFIIVPTTSSVITYLVVASGLVEKCFATLPWAMPPFLIGFFASGDWKYIFLSVFNLAFGYFCFKPFFRAWEKNELKKIEGNIEEEVKIES